MAEGRRRRFGLAVWLPIAWIAFVLGCAISADWWAMPESDYMDFLSQGAPPGAVGEVPLRGTEELAAYTYWLGTDTLGRDILTRLFHGARVSLTLGLIAPIIGLLVGGSLRIGEYEKDEPA